MSGTMPTRNWLGVAGDVGANVGVAILGPAVEDDRGVGFSVGIDDVVARVRGVLDHGDAGGTPVHVAQDLVVVGQLAATVPKHGGSEHHGIHADEDRAQRDDGQ
jgi:nucleoside-diphosphate-sugar epimerase